MKKGRFTEGAACDFNACSTRRSSSRTLNASSVIDTSPPTTETPNLEVTGNPGRRPGRASLASLGWELKEFDEGTA